MKGKETYLTGKVLEYVPKEAITSQYTQNKILESINYFEKNGILPLRQNIEKRTGFGKSSVHAHLTKLIKSEHITVKYAKVELENTVAISGIYHSIGFKTNKEKKK